jgi:hypothetical protein
MYVHKRATAPRLLSEAGRHETTLNCRDTQVVTIADGRLIYLSLFRPGISRFFEARRCGTSREALSVACNRWVTLSARLAGIAMQRAWGRSMVHAVEFVFLEDDETECGMM